VAMRAHRVIRGQARLQIGHDAHECDLVKLFFTRLLPPVFEAPRS
jgi:hypothetical protein